MDTTTLLDIVEDSLTLAQPVLSGSLQVSASDHTELLKTLCRVLVHVRDHLLDELT